jgi:hypothetical protein
MCEFISWITTKDESVLFVTDADLKKLESRKDNDPLGHGAIRFLYCLNSIAGKEGECQDFWIPENYPEEIASILRSPEKIKNTWGEMIGRHMQKGDLRYVYRRAPKWACELVTSQVVRFALKYGNAKRATHGLMHAPNLSNENRDALVGVIVEQKVEEWAADVLLHAPNLSEKNQDALVGVIGREWAACVLNYALNLSEKNRDVLRAIY